MSKRKALDEIAKVIESCKVCKANKFGKAVSGEGSPNAKIMFIGEAPGKTESETGRPFVGRSGKFLRLLIESIGLKRKNVFITSPVKYFPGYRTPTPEEIRHGRNHLDRQIEIIRPKIIVLLGNVAARGVLGQSFAVTVMHSKILEQDGRKHFFTYHPAAALRFPKIRKLMFSDFKKLNSLLFE